jgi:aminoglycoside 6'-N-acetyltransferase
VQITFRPSTAADLPMLHRWLNEPGVVEWWEGDDVSWDSVVRDYGPDRDDGTEHWIAQLDGRDIGWIQCYAAKDSDDEAAAWFPLGVDEQAAGIDYLLGEPVERGRGIGSAMIRAFADEIVFGRHPNWTQACASPYAANVASCRALEKAGFTFRGTVDDPDGSCSLMVLDRAAPENASRT